MIVKTQFDAVKFMVTLKVWRKMHNLSIVELATMVEIPASSLSFIETGERTPKIAELNNLLAIMEFDACEFFKSPEKGQNGRN